MSWFLSHAGRGAFVKRLNGTTDVFLIEFYHRVTAVSVYIMYMYLSNLIFHTASHLVTSESAPTTQPACLSVPGEVMTQAAGPSPFQRGFTSHHCSIIALTTNSKCVLTSQRRHHIIAAHRARAVVNSSYVATAGVTSPSRTTC